MWKIPCYQQKFFEIVEVSAPVEQFVPPFDHPCVVDTIRSVHHLSCFMVPSSLMNRWRIVVRLRACALLVSLLVFFAAPELVRAQSFLIDPTTVGQFQVSNWKSYTSLVSARAVCQDTSGRLWVACGGGVFSVRTATGEYSSFRNTEGMNALNTTSIAYHKRSNSIYVGTFDGTVEILQLDSMQWSYINDIRSASEQYPRRSINSIQFRGDTAIYCTDFGISLFDIRRMVFIETVDRIGWLEEKVPVHMVLFKGDTLMAATDAGVMIAPIKTTTLRLPEIWSRYASVAKDTLPNCLQLCVHPKGGIYAMTPKAIYILDRDTFRLVQQQIASYWPFKALVAYDTTLYFCTSERIATLGLQTMNVKHPSALSTINVVATQGAPMLLALYQNSGVGIVADSTLRLFAPNSMYSGRAQRMVVDKGGRLWVATSNLSIDGQGYSQFDGNSWHNYNTSLFPGFYSDMVWRMSLSNDSLVWGGTWGNGVLRMSMQNDTIVTTRYDSTNSPLVGIAGGNFVLTGDAASDNKGNSWLVNYDPAGGDGPLLHRIAPDGSWTPFRNDIGASRNYYILAVDASNTKWLGGPNGLIWFNENSAGSKWGVVNMSNSTLPDNTVTSLSVDQNGALWIGTAAGGVGVMSFPSGVTRSVPTIPVVTRLRLLRDQVINDIMVDAQNNKWIATSNGVWVMTGDGTDTIGYLSQKSYPYMLSNNVRCLASNPLTGTVYIGGTEGINAIQTLALRPLDNFSLDVYPVPFAPERDKQLTIDGLAPEAVIHITTLDGQLIKAIETTSRRAVWDGRDKNGTVVSNGVYLVFSVSQGAASSAVSKILVSP